MKKHKIVSLILIVLLIVNCFPFLGDNHLTYAEENNDTKSVLDNIFKKNTNVVDKNKNEKEEDTNQPDAIFEQKVIEDYYADALSNWEAEGIQPATNFSTVIHPTQFSTNKASLEIISREKSKGYDEPVLLFDDQTERVNFQVQVPQEGLYQIRMDYYSIPGKIIPAERGIQINGEYQFFESRRIVFSKLWKNETNHFEKDDMNNDMLPNQVEVEQWQTTEMMDASYFFDQPLTFHLKKGKNTISINHVRESMMLGNIYVQSPEILSTYEEYLDQNNKSNKEISVLNEYEAEKSFVKSVPSIQAVPNADPNVSPHQVGTISLNTLGEETWKMGGQSVTWKITASETGYYNMAFKYLQPKNTNMPVFRSIQIDGEVPFKEVSSYPFPFTKEWENEILSSHEGKPYQFFLEKGEHELTLIANSAPLGTVVKTVRDTMDEIKDLSLKIKMATGNKTDKNRDWDIVSQIPDISSRLEKSAKQLRTQYEYLEKLSDQKPDAARNLLISAEQLELLAMEPNEIPAQINLLDQGSGSVLQMLGDLFIALPNQPLQLDKFYLFSDKELPNAKASIWQRMKAGTQNFALSFTKDYNEVGTGEEEAIEVWVNRPRQYVSLMQQMADKNFTEKTGIKVSLSLMPEEQKLILANAAEKTPDVALGLTNSMPYELALRGAVQDLSEFEDFDQTSQRFSQGALLPFIFDNGYYALPDTQNFWVLFYRKDITEALDIPIPDTWDDVMNVLPELQRYGMNFYVPLSAAGGFKNFPVTVPYIYQQGGNLFAENGMEAAIDTDEALKGIELMTKSFTIYSMPLQVPNFYNHFREGSLPMGIADFATYVQLTTAAPELAGWWKIAPLPGIKNENGEVVRWAPGSGQANIIFKDSKQKEKAWEFFKWWASEETQVEFGNSIETIYGPAYKWNTSNLEAFDQLSWPEEDKKVITEQWKWLKDVPHIPGDYMLEREISNAWNKIVFNGENTRKAMEDALVIANREIKKKLEEFGYTKDGKVVKELEVPTINEPSNRGESE